MAESTTALQIRLNAELRQQSEDILNRMGLTISDGIRVFLQQVVNTGGLPFQPTAKRDVDAELKRLQRIIQADQDFAEMRAGNYAILTEDGQVIDNANSSQ